MNIEDMTPEQLRDYALTKEELRKDITARYMWYEQDEPETAPTRQPWERDVEFEGEVYPRGRAANQVARVHPHVRQVPGLREARRGRPSGRCARPLRLRFQRRRRREGVRGRCGPKMGYEDFEEIMRIENGLFENIDLKT